MLKLTCLKTVSKYENFVFATFDEPDQNIHKSHLALGTG